MSSSRCRSEVFCARMSRITADTPTIDPRGAHRRRRDGDVDALAAFGDPHDVGLDGLAADGAPEGAGRPFRAVGRHEQAGRRADRLRGGVAEQRLGGRVPGLDAALGGEAHHRVARCGDDGGEARIGLLGPAQVVDVGRRADPGALLALERHDRQEVPAVRFLAGAQPDDDLEQAACRDALGAQTLGRGAIVRMDVRQAPGEIQPGLAVEVVATPVAVKAGRRPAA